jgi:hypothetical protein
MLHGSAHLTLDQHGADSDQLITTRYHLRTEYPDHLTCGLNVDNQPTYLDLSLFPQERKSSHHINVGEYYGARFRPSKLTF